MQLTDTTAIPVIIGLTQVVKELGVPDHFAPVASLVLGILAGFVLEPNPVNAVVTGLMFGLSASGFYAGAKTVSAYVQNGPTNATPTPTEAELTPPSVTPNNEGATNTI